MTQITTLGDTDFATIQEASARKSVNYIKWTDENRYSIGKYASELGNTTAVRNFQKQFPHIKESTVREFKKRYEKQLHEAKKRNLQSPT